jgi:hypothetical protein
MAARPHLKHNLQFLVTFQGYELYSMYARAIGREQELYALLRRCVEESDWPAIAVSADYLQRVKEDIGVEESKMSRSRPACRHRRGWIARKLKPSSRRNSKSSSPASPSSRFLAGETRKKASIYCCTPLAMLRRRGYQFQLICAGPTLWGNHYGQICMQIAEELRCPVLWRRYVEDEVRTALFSQSVCVVYPSIHREPFGMVPVEAQAHGTPAIVPDLGGVADTIRANGEFGGLHFKTWNSGDLAEKIAMLFDDSALRTRLSQAGPRVAEYYSVKNLADRVLRHIGLPERP